MTNIPIIKKFKYLEYFINTDKMTNDNDLVFAEIINMEKSFTSDLISKITYASADKYNDNIIKTVVLFHPKGWVHETSTPCTKYRDINFVRHLKCNNVYLNFEHRRDYNYYVLYKKLINSFLKSNPEYKMAGDEFGFISWCCSADVVFEFVHEPELV